MPLPTIISQAGIVQTPGGDLSAHHCGNSDLNKSLKTLPVLDPKSLLPKLSELHSIEGLLSRTVSAPPDGWSGREAVIRPFKGDIGHALQAVAKTSPDK
jgi:hypothetical protein